MKTISLEDLILLHDTCPGVHFDLNSETGVATANIGGEDCIIPYSEWCDYMGMNSGAGEV